MNSVARKIVAPSPAAPKPTARAAVAPTRLRPNRRYLVRLCSETAEAAVLVKEVSCEAAAVAYAERTGAAEAHMAVMVTDCETGCAESFLLDLVEDSIGSC